MERERKRKREREERQAALGRLVALLRRRVVAVAERAVVDAPLRRGKVPYYTASHTNPHTTLHLNK